MPLDQETIDQQRELLAAHRRTLAQQLTQQAQFSAGHIPAHVANGIVEARASISHIKEYLRKNSVSVEDERNEEILTVIPPAAAEAEHKIAEQRAQDAVLATYISQIEDLLIDKKLLKSEPGDEIRLIARTRTLTAIRRLDSGHNQKLIQFLQDGNLFQEQFTPIIDLREANLYGAKLSFANLRSANLEWANLEGANLEGANLEGANLRGANLQGANLEEANLKYANLEGAKLRSANLERANLREANLEWANLRSANLQGANLERAKLIVTGGRWLYTSLRSANLRGANLKGAFASNEQFLDALSLEEATMPDGSIHE